MGPENNEFEKLYEVLMAGKLLKDIQRLSTKEQTAGLEDFHTVINHFAPKMIGFSYLGMKTRIILAALHYNENANREARRTMDGEAQVNIASPKYKAGEPILRVLREKATYDYVTIL